MVLGLTERESVTRSAPAGGGATDALADRLPRDGGTAKPSFMDTGSRAIQGALSRLDSKAFLDMHRQENGE